nr:hypothetical protein [Pseudomonas viridiflava]
MQLGDRLHWEINREQHQMVIIEDDFTSGAKVSMQMDKEARELFVFHCPSGQGCKVSKWPLDSYHMPIALAHYTECCELEKAA